MAYFDELVQNCINSIANTLELLQSRTEPSILSQTTLKYLFKCTDSMNINAQ